MARRKKRIGRFWWFLLFAMAIAGTVYRWQGFAPQHLVENSALNGRTFAADVQEVVSPKHGVRAYLITDKTNPIVAMSFLFANAGKSADKNSEQGMANMLAAVLSEGTVDKDSQAFKEELEDYAISIGYSVDRDDFSGSLLTIKENSTKAFELLKKSLLQPRLDAEDIKRLKDQALVLLKRQQERPEARLLLMMNKKMYKNHPYARNPLGKKEDILKFDADKIAAFKRENLGRSNLVVGIAGDMDVLEAGKMLDDVFGELPEDGAKPLVDMAEVDFNQSAEVEEDIAQNITFVAAKGVARQSVDFYPLYIANHILGGAGLSSRLNIEAREKQGLTYGVSTYMSTAQSSPLIMGSFSTTPENFAKMKEIFAVEWDKFATQGVSEEELQNAKDYLIASYNLRFADIGVIADILMQMQKENLGIDFLQKRNGYVDEVTIRQVNRVADKYFDRSNLLMMTIGKF